MYHDQLEVFRRGVEEADPADFPDGREFGDQGEFTWPEGYVIPMGEDQRSDAAAVDLVNHLLRNGVQVDRLGRTQVIDGTRYELGSYVVDMAQPKRGLANTILEDGWDISELVPQMYDISGWSHGLLWGADVVRVDDDVPFDPKVAPVKHEQRAWGSMPHGSAGAYGFNITDATAVEAVNALLDGGAELWRDENGLIIAPRSARADVFKNVAKRGVDVVALESVPSTASELTALGIGCACSNDEYFTLSSLGFEVTRVSEGSLNDGQSLDDVDVLWVSSGLDHEDLNDDAQAEIDEFLEDGALIGGGRTGADFSDAAGALTVGVENGPGRANGIVAVERTPGTPTTGAYEPAGHSFVYSPVWFTDVPDSAIVNERLGTGEFFVSGHWIGHDEAAGAATVVSGTSAGGADVVLFGTRPLFRDHPKGMYPQVANALFWATAD
jgi:hypothetical protein